MSSNFAVQRQGNYGFSAVACDQTNGFSMNPATVHRGLLSPSERAAITRNFYHIAGMDLKPR